MNDSVLQLWHGVLFRQRPDSSLEWISPRIQEWTGLEPHRALEAVHPGDRPKLAVENTTFRLRHARTGRITWVEQRRRGVTSGYEGYWENITERVHRNHQLSQAQWNATLGSATNRLVHDFNNLLTGILSLSDAYLTLIKPDNPAQEGLKLLNQQARQAADIVQQIGSLFREAPGRRSHHDLRGIVTSAADILQRVLPRHTSLKVQGESEPIAVHLDAAELKQVIVSLATAVGPASLVLETRPPARLQISGEMTEALNDKSPAMIHARSFAERNDAELAAHESSFTLNFRPADFSDAETARPQSILMLGRETKALFDVADLFRRNSYEVVVGGEDFLDLLRSPDYRFDGVWMRNEDSAGTVEKLRQHFPALKRVASAASAPDELLAELRGALAP